MKLLTVSLIVSGIVNAICFFIIHKTYKKLLSYQLTIKMLKDMKEWMDSNDK